MKELRAAVCAPQKSSAPTSQHSHRAFVHHKFSTRLFRVSTSKGWRGGGFDPMRKIIFRHEVSQRYVLSFMQLGKMAEVFHGMWQSWLCEWDLKLTNILECRN